MRSYAKFGYPQQIKEVRIISQITHNGTVYGLLLDNKNLKRIQMPFLLFLKRGRMPLGKQTNLKTKL